LAFHQTPSGFDDTKVALTTSDYDGLMSWRMKLTKPLTLSDGTILKTLNDARKCFLDRFAGVTHNDALAYAGALLLTAAETGEPADIEAATRQIERTLSAMRLMP
jgi:hypothetical protein